MKREAYFALHASRTTLHDLCTQRITNNKMGILNDNYICALDIGSSKVAGCMAILKKGRIGNIYFDSVALKGIEKGVIVDSVNLIIAVTALVKKLKALSGMNIKFVHVNISGKNLFAKHSRAIIPLAERGNKVITVSDIHRVNEQARILASSLEDEIIHAIPFNYIIDSKTSVISPIGLYSHSLEADLYLVCAKLSAVQNLSRVIHQSGYEMKKLFFSGLAVSKAVFNCEFLKGLNLLCDIGGDVTELLIFRDGALVDMEILFIGGNDLTKCLQEELRIPFDLAEDIKRSHGLLGKVESIAPDKEILVKKEQSYRPIKLKFLAEILNSRANSICQEIKGAVEKKVALHQVNNFIVTGRSILLEGFIETLEANLSVPVKSGGILNPDIPLSIKENDALSGRKYLNYLSCLGMICDALQIGPQIIPPAAALSKNFIINAMSRIKEVYQEYF